jgi:hypothetical protein
MADGSRLRFRAGRRVRYNVRNVDETQTKEFP